MSISIDLNADLGEHPNSDLDEQIMPFISSCNIACGGHIGSESSVRKTVLLARKFGVSVGAHPSYPDRENFGRKIIQIQPQELADSISEQVLLLKRICQEEEVKLHHIKPHGALYNHAASDEFVSKLILNVIKEVTDRVYWMGLANSVSEKVALDSNYPFIAEGFADRQYEADGSLMSRLKEGSVLQGAQVMYQVEELAINKRVKVNEWLPLNVQSICLHGDTKGAVTLAKEINSHLVAKGVQIAAV